MVLPSSGPISLSDIKSEYNGDYPCPGCKDMKGYDDYPGADQGEPDQFGFLNDYPSAISQGFTDSDIRCYIEKVYQFIPGKQIGPLMQAKLADPNFGPISASSNTIPINQYYRDPSTSVENSSYVKTKFSGGDHPNTANIPTSGPPIEFAQFRGSYSVIGFNRYLSGAYGFSLHFYTASPNGEILGAPNYYNLEGDPNYFYIHGGPVFSNSVPLHRFFNNSQNGGGPHLFTRYKSEGSNAGFSYEGIVGYVYPSSGPNLSAIHRGTSNEGDFLYTYYQDEINNAGYQYNGVAFYAYSSTNWR